MDDNGDYILATKPIKQENFYRTLNKIIFKNGIITIEDFYGYSYNGTEGERNYRKHSYDDRSRCSYWHTKESEKEKNY